MNKLAQFTVGAGQEGAGLTPGKEPGSKAVSIRAGSGGGGRANSKTPHTLLRLKAANGALCHASRCLQAGWQEEPELYLQTSPCWFAQRRVNCHLEAAISGSSGQRGGFLESVFREAAGAAGGCCTMEMKRKLRAMLMLIWIFPGRPINSSGSPEACIIINFLKVR